MNVKNLGSYKLLQREINSYLKSQWIYQKGFQKLSNFPYYKRIPSTLDSLKIGLRGHLIKFPTLMNKYKDIQERDNKSLN